MSVRRIFSLRVVAFALAPALFLLVAAETAVRVKYFFAHGREWSYLTAPFGRGGFRPTENWTFVRSAEAATVNGPPAGTGEIADADTPRGAAAHAPTDQMVFKWVKPCADRMVHSTELQKELPRTFDQHCFRGDRVTEQKDAGEYRIVFVGGSTVEDAQSDAEMMTAQFKNALPPTHGGKRITVVNTGKAGYESRRIGLYWAVSLRSFSPDMVLYYEAWNEQPTSAKWRRVDERIATIGNRLHESLYYRSMFYTYMVEKFAFLAVSNDHFWKIDVDELGRNFMPLARDVRDRGARFVFVTQVVQFPRIWKGADTFDYHAVDALLDRLKTDRQYVYDVREISALNQRLAVVYTINLCREHDIPVVNILEPVESLGESERAGMFMDLGHLTVKGDRIIGRLIAERLNLSE